MPKNSSGDDVVKFMPIHTDDGKYNQGAMTIQEICAQASGLQLAVTDIAGKTITLTGAFSGTTIAGTTGSFTSSISATRAALTSGMAVWGVASQAAQFATTGTSLGVVLGSGSSLDVKTTFTGNSSTTAYTISDIVSALKQVGILAL